MKVVVDVGCGHQTCKDCFVAYMEASFEQNSFIILPPHGYTLSCPVYGCRGIFPVFRMLIFRLLR
ncbi:unnamed protein product [Anisakis simplex]|uniref:Zf-RING_14 domain-containing protein n=1 Tax=Anisakis simplex TaxID=6269 RepID=A0A0M3JIY5_ANISI|nr:unnamed protein product [Anisakis simplex]